jgi:riboflavin kinase/FMN adenylyltransferase
VVDAVPVGDTRRNVVAIGVFDGVHRGHQLLVRRAVTAARERSARAVVVTFDPHPTTVTHPDAVPQMLTTIERRVQLLRDCGADDVVVLPFTRELSKLSPQEFVDQILTDQLQVVHIVVGIGWRFGHKASGDIALLRRLGVSVDAVDLMHDDADVVSSTWVRRRLVEGDVAAAARVLGRPHLVEGPVVHGDKRGRELGYPTANLLLPATLAIPADGVYAGYLSRDDGQRMPAAVSVGTNPTFDGVVRRVEAYVLDVDIDLYDQHVVVEFAANLRGMVKFDSVDDLVQQMGRDVDQTREVLAT